MRRSIEGRCLEIRETGLDWPWLTPLDSSFYRASYELEVILIPLIEVRFLSFEVIPFHVLASSPSPL